MVRRVETPTMRGKYRQMSQEKSLGSVFSARRFGSVANVGVLTTNMFVFVVASSFDFAVVSITVVVDLVAAFIIVDSVTVVIGEGVSVKDCAEFVVKSSAVCVTLNIVSNVISEASFTALLGTVGRMPCGATKRSVKLLKTLIRVPYTQCNLFQSDSPSKILTPS